MQRHHSHRRMMGLNISSIKQMLGQHTISSSSRQQHGISMVRPLLWYDTSFCSVMVALPLPSACCEDPWLLGA